MDKNKFRELVNSDIDITNDHFVIKSKEILGIENPKISGSYLKYGRDKACDLDMKEGIYVNSIDNRNNILQSYINKLKDNKKDFEVVKIKIYIDDPRIRKIIDKIGYINGLLEIKDFDSNEINIDPSLPKEIQNKINELINTYDNEQTIDNYVYLNNYLYDINYPEWTFEELIKGKKKINDEFIDLYDVFFNNIYIEIIIDKFLISNFIHFTGLGDDSEPETFKQFDLYDMTINNRISYYNLLKKIQHFIKWAYWNKLLKEKEIIRNTIFVYNQIDEFREKIGKINNETCLISTKSILENDKIEKHKLKKDYEIKYEDFNKLSKEKYEKVAKIYSIYLGLYLRTR
jgi:hypothetical protein